MITFLAIIGVIALACGFVRIVIAFNQPGGPSIFSMSMLRGTVQSSAEAQPRREFLFQPIGSIFASSAPIKDKETKR